MTETEQISAALEALDKLTDMAGREAAIDEHEQWAATIRSALTETYTLARLAQGEARQPSDYYDVDVPCSRCGGLGRRAYPDSSTWRGGIGGQTLTSDVCDKCWGSGEEHRPWRSWHELKAKFT